MHVCVHARQSPDSFSRHRSGVDNFYFQLAFQSHDFFLQVFSFHYERLLSCHRLVHILLISAFPCWKECNTTLIFQIQMIMNTCRTASECLERQHVLIPAAMKLDYSVCMLMCVCVCVDEKVEEASVCTKKVKG